MLKSKNYTLIIYFALTFVAIYFYFFNWQINTPYGDDLFLFRDHYALNNFYDQVFLMVSAGKLRPVHGFIFNVAISAFQKNLHYYYILNVFVFSLATVSLAGLFNLFLHSRLFSFLFSLTFGLSRFAYFSVGQLHNGAALEGIANLFFICTVYFTVRTLINNNHDTSDKFRNLILAIVFANLSLYTHERYISSFLFIALVVQLYPSLRSLSAKQKIILIGLSVASPIFNIFIKEIGYSMPFLLGTNASQMTFSVSSALTFLKEGVLSIFLMNTGPEYLIGLSFGALKGLDKILAFSLFLSFIGLIGFYVWKLPIATTRYIVSRVVTPNVLKDISYPRHLFLVVFLAVLFGLSLAPCLFTIRLEQRWLVAPYAVFALMIVIIISELKFNSSTTRNIMFSLLAVSMLWVNYEYQNKGFGNTYMLNSENSNKKFKDALHNGVISKKTKRLYMWEPSKDMNTRNGMLWSMCGNYLLKFYDGNVEQLTFVDSTFIKTDSGFITSFPNFDSSTDQIVFLGPELSDITGDYVRDSLKNLPGSN